MKDEQEEDMTGTSAAFSGRAFRASVRSVL